ncbi:cysteine desulfurase [Mucilaginibacter pineti]|uniref:cysteine desulfurase n=1 Tax=Mucilaginibacter pineti TaxID=1391627 RepID=A0A1G7IK65_9SPHI|nr:cysteine desulfurase family protein [Mucilaginibacter pineti]SDF13023.1 cysteine desulfurase [Mucilaginibacter pineti]
MIYLDNHATTSCDPRVVEQMLPFFTDNYGNPSSDHHFGLAAAEAVNKATEQISLLIGGRKEEIIITSGATESINLAIIGITNNRLKKTGKKNKIVTTRIEHKAVLMPIAYLETQGWVVDYLPVDDTGLIDLTEAEKIIDDNTYLISVQLANSEIGTIQPLAALAALSKSSGAFFHCDASQGIGKVIVNVDELGIDFLSFSGHKIYGPKGVGILWIKDGLKRLLNPIMFGGGALGSIRPGTLPVPLIVGLGAACQLLNECFDKENSKTMQLRDLFEKILVEKISGLIINGAKNNRLSNNSNITFPNVDAEMLLGNLPDLVMSTGSACESGSIEPSRVLTELGISSEAAFNTIRVGFGRFNTLDQTNFAAEEIIKAYTKISRIIDNF